MRGSLERKHAGELSLFNEANATNCNSLIGFFCVCVCVQAAFSDFLQRSSRDLSKHVRVVVSANTLSRLSYRFPCRHVWASDPPAD